MRVLLLVTAFNGLSQRIYGELKAQGHQLSVVLGGHESEVCQAVSQFDPDLILCPFLKHRIPDDIWQQRLCVIIHPGIQGDRGPSSLDWAIIEQQAEWGVTALQADAEMDAGDIWATGPFPMRPASKASLYRREVTATASKLVQQLMERLAHKGFRPEPLDYQDPKVQGELKPLMKQPMRRIDWLADDSDTILRKIRAADSFPGVLTELYGELVYLYGAHPENELGGALPKTPLATREGALCIATIDGAIWVSHMKRKSDAPQFKLPAAWVLKAHLDGVPELAPPLLPAKDAPGYQQIRYEEQGEVGYLHFDFHNGAMGTSQCRRLLHAYQAASRRNIRVLVLMGGEDFWSNGIHLNHIEAADNPADESWRNINAINDLVKAILLTDDKLTVAALGANAGAGGAMMALACDQVVAREGVVLNPHYQTMGLYGSEYWTYSLPKRVGEAMARRLTEACLPVGTAQALALGLVDKVLSEARPRYLGELIDYCQTLADDQQFGSRLRAKAQTRSLDEAQHPLAEYRRQELTRMHHCFYEADSDYHRLRREFVYKVCPCATPERLVYRSPLVERTG
ncbi:hydrogenase maturation protein [Ferrimonas sediminicola]|uniref:Hydrogenase maturation protein n=1 Tax=Ferrimonas sediminicola TaxID=2569538 RepID=A0A4U1BIK4_9GAMM|nr:hydrogenase maturation protein [Ferrimonas sediminicola]TKB49876.1 hydrogenase maturation protein [Ferrimonas sediminicola]